MIFHFRFAAQKELKCYFKRKFVFKKLHSISAPLPPQKKKHATNLCGFCADSGDVGRVPETLGVRRRPHK